MKAAQAGRGFWAQYPGAPEGEAGQVCRALVGVVGVLDEVQAVLAAAHRHTDHPGDHPGRVVLGEALGAAAAAWVHAAHAAAVLAAHVQDRP